MDYKKYFCPICENKIINHMNIRKDSRNKYIILCSICFENYKYCKSCDLYVQNNKFLKDQKYKLKCLDCLSK